MAIDMNRFLKEKRYEAAAAAPASIASDLDQIAGADKLAESKARFWMIIGVVFLIVSIVCLFVFPPAVVVTGPIFVIGFIMRAVRARGDIDDRRYQLPRELIKMLELDMGESPRFDCKIQFQRCDRKDTFSHKGKAGTWNVKYYCDPWLSIAGTFCDGTGFEIQMSEMQQNRSKWKTNPRGKRKYKTKKKHGGEFSVILKPKAKRYGAVEKLADDIGGAVQLPQGAVLKKASWNGKQLLISAAIKGMNYEAAAPSLERPRASNAVQMFAMLMLSAYHVLGLAREITKKSGAA